MADSEATFPPIATSIPPSEPVNGVTEVPTPSAPVVSTNAAPEIVSTNSVANDHTSAQPTPPQLQPSVETSVIVTPPISNVKPVITFKITDFKKEGSVEHSFRIHFSTNIHKRNKTTYEITDVEPQFTASIERTFTELIHFHHFLVSTPCLIRTVIPPPLPLITPYDDPNTKITANELNNERVQNFFTRLQNNEALVREVFALVEHNAASLETGIAEAEGGWAFLESQFAYQPPTHYLKKPTKLSSSYKDIDIYLETLRKDLEIYYDAILDTSLAKACKSLSKTYKELGKSSISVASECNQVTSMDQYELARVFSKLSRTVLTSADSIEAQREYYGTHVPSQLNVLQESLKALIVALDSRVSLLKQYETACGNTQKKVAVLEKLRRKAGSSLGKQVEKIDVHIEELNSLRDVESRLRAQMHQVNLNLGAQVKRFLDDLMADIEDLCVGWVKRQLIVEKEFLGIFVDMLNEMES